MRCEDVERLLSGRTLAELSGADNAAVGAHLASCPACREKWGLDGQSQEFHEAIKAMRAREGAEHSLLAKLDAEQGAAEPRPTPLPSEMPKQLGGFEVLELLGRGGMGSVYKARQVSLGRLVALKVISARLAADERFLVRFEREARAAAAVHHPNIIAVYSVGEDNGRHYIAMELVAGEGLGALVQREGPLPQDRALGLMKQTAAALAAAHEAGIVHRDIKPSNILLAADGSVKVADFGLAKRIQIDVKVTATGTTVGTPLYMAPEAAGAKPLDARTDLYSLGATFYHVLAGRPPFEGRTPVEVIVKHATEEPQPLAAAAPHLDPRLCAIVDRLLRKDPAERYPSARALLDDLEALCPLRTPAQAARAEGEAMIREAQTLTLGPGRRLEREAVLEARLRAQRPTRSRRTLVTVGVIAAFVVVAAVIVATPRPERSATAPPPTEKIKVVKPPEETKKPPPVDDEAEKRQAELGAAARRAWAKIEAAPRGDLTPPQAKALAALLDEFTHKYEGTGAYQAAQEQSAALRERIRAALTPPPGEWVGLFDGKTLKGWRVVKESPGAGPGGEARVEDGRIVLPPGKPATAIAWNGEFPVNDYEVRFQATRVGGDNEFSSVVFPVGWASCQLVLGGWGGTVVGVNIVDGRRPHEDATARKFVFASGHWYSFLLRVTTAKVEAWIGEQKVVDLTRADHGFWCENVATPMRPFAFYSLETSGAVREIQIRELTPGVLKGLTVQGEPEALTTVSFTAPSDAQGLRPICEGDGLFAEGGRDGKAVLHQQAGRPQHDYLYFWAAEAFAEQFRTDASKTAFLSITLLDTAPGSVGVDYDSHAQLPNTDGGRWTGTGRQRLGGTGQWVEVRFPLPRARFGHRQNYGADFRICHSADLLVHRVAVASKEDRAEEERTQGTR